jgi:hypothetical protein
VLIVLVTALVGSFTTNRHQRAPATLSRTD